VELEYQSRFLVTAFAAWISRRCIQVQGGWFNHRMATLVADKLRRWFTLGIRTNWGSLSKPYTSMDS